MADTRLEDFEHDPDRLARYSFERVDEPNTDAVHRVWFDRPVGPNDTRLRLVLRVEFEVLITDYPDRRGGSNRSYMFNGVSLRALDRGQRDVLAGYELEIETLEEVERLTKLLTPAAQRLDTDRPV